MPQDPPCPPAPGPMPRPACPHAQPCPKEEHSRSPNPSTHTPPPNALRSCRAMRCCALAGAPCGGSCPSQDQRSVLSCAPAPSPPNTHSCCARAPPGRPPSKTPSRFVTPGPRQRLSTPANPAVAFVMRLSVHEQQPLRHRHSSRRMGPCEAASRSCRRPMPPPLHCCPSDARASRHGWVATPAPSQPTAKPTLSCSRTQTRMHAHTHSRAPRTAG